MGERAGDLAQGQALENLVDARARQTLREVFGFTAFRPLQAEIVASMLAGQDVFVLMPTGGGKSLCYQLPALLHDGLTVVVSPLIALMKDQVDALDALGVPATFINSSLELSEIRRRQALVARGRVKLLYVAPERLMTPGFLRLLTSVNVARFAIDEAHCISEWGHDFRPEYRALGRLRAEFPRAPLATFTATATPRVQADIIRQLELDGAAIYRGSFNRPNLYYEVRPKQSAYHQLVDYLRQRERASGIIYCGSRDGTERLAADLRADGFSAAAYHAGLDAEERRQRQEAFVRDDVDIIVATIAFGMGIDKPDVRFVIHYDLPRNLEGYYQETGRAGRDGEPSDCILFYSYGDAVRHRYFIDQKPDERERAVALDQLRRMTDWASAVTCRRRALLAYFDESLPESAERCCDVCNRPAEREDATVPAQMLLSCVKRTGERFGAAHIVDVLRGSRSQRVLRWGHERLPTYGIGRERPKEYWHHLVRELLAGGYLRQSAEEYNALKVTEAGRAILFDGQRITITAPAALQVGEPGSADYDSGLFERLRALRKRLAEERQVPPYVIFSDRTLREMATQLPRSRDELRRLHGVGDRKAAEFGDAFLALITESGASPPAARPSPGAPVRPRASSPGDSVRRTLDMLLEGQTLAEIAETRGLSLPTVEEHAVRALEAGAPLDIRSFVPDERRQRIEAAFAQIGDERLAPAREILGEDYSYQELRLVRAWRRRRSPASPPPRR